MNERKRLDTLRKYNILDSPKDRVFDHITKLTSRLLNVPIAVISIVDKDRIWFKSTHGLDVSEIKKENGLCATAILSNDLYLIEDARTDSRCKDNSLVTGHLNLQFYAGIPLKVENGENLGMLCVIDNQPRTLSIEEQELLKDLAFLVVEQFEIKSSVNKVMNQQIEMSNMLKSIYESTRESSTFIGKDLKVRYTNQASKKITKQLFGKEKEIGDDALDYVLPDYKSEFKALFKRALKGEFIDIELTDGTTWWNITMYPVYDKNDVIVGLAHNVHDITTSKNNLLKVLQQNEVLKEIAWQQCHEVRGPLANILGFCNLLKDEDEQNNVERQKYINYLQDATLELDKIIHKIVAQSMEKYYDA